MGSGRRQHTEGMAGCSGSRRSNSVRDAMKKSQGQQRARAVVLILEAGLDDLPAVRA